MPVSHKLIEREVFLVIIGLKQVMRFCFYILPIVLVSGAFAADSGEAHRRQVTSTARVVPVVKSDPRSGQLVRTIVVTPRLVESRLVTPQAPPEVSVASAPAPSEVRDMIEQTAKAYEVSPALVDSVVQVESNYNARAVSPKGAQGLMQLMPDTARRFGVSNTFDPKQNIEGGVRYLRFLQDTFKDERLAIAAYNAGEGAVQKYGNVPPYTETMDYVVKVGKKYGQAKRAAESRRAAEAKTEPVVKAPEYRPLTQFTDAQGRVYLSTK